MSYVSEVAGRIRREVPPEVLPDGDTDLLFLIYATLALTLGEDVQPEHVHDAWAAWMAYQNPSHDSIKPFEELDPETKREDEPFVNAIAKVASQLARNRGPAHER